MAGTGRHIRPIDYYTHKLCMTRVVGARDIKRASQHGPGEVTEVVLQLECGHETKPRHPSAANVNASIAHCEICDALSRAGNDWIDRLNASLI